MTTAGKRRGSRLEAKELKSICGRWTDGRDLSHHPECHEHLLGGAEMQTARKNGKGDYAGLNLVFSNNCRVGGLTGDLSLSEN